MNLWRGRDQGTIMWCVATHLVLNSVDHRRKQQERARRASARLTGCVEYGIGWRQVGVSMVLSVPAREAEYGGGA